MPKTMDIEALLRWAFVDELPKEASSSTLTGIGYVSAWGGIERYGELLTMIDAPANRWGVVPSGAGSDPHPDAVAIGDAVRRLDDIEVAPPEGWDPLCDLATPDLGAQGLAMLRACAAGAYERITTLDADGRTRVVRFGLFDLVRRCAILGRPPAWEADAPRVVSIKGDRGRERWFRRATLTGADGIPYEVELDGYDARRKRPHPDAYRKFRLEPDPLDAAVARAEYEVWHAALALLVVDLDGRLADHRATGPARAERPWMGPAQDAARILPDIGSVARRAAGVAGERFEASGRRRAKKDA